MKHCCDKMRFFLKENEVDIYYEKDVRGYLIGMKHGMVSRQQIDFCPWCGKKLPENLMNAWFDILENEYGIEDTVYEKSKIPKEFRTDEWWKKRGL